MGANELVKMLRKIIKEDRKPQAIDTEAEVKRVEDGIAWVHIPGGVDETPVKLTIDAKKGDTVQVRVAKGRAWLVGNATRPPTDDTEAKRAQWAAVGAGRLAKKANDKAKDARTEAEEAQSAANIANEAASGALCGLATVEDVIGVLERIQQHGVMTLTSDTTVNPNHVYFVVDPNGTYVVQNVHYSVVATPEDSELSTYYELNIDESLNNYVMTHVATTAEGLWILPDANSGYKILIATGAGSIYTSPGTYIIDADGKPVARFRTSTVIGKDGESRAIIDYKSFKLVDKDDNEQFAVNSLGGYATVAKAIKFTETRSGDDGIATLSEDVANGTIMTVCLAQTLGIPGIRESEMAYTQFTKGIIESKTINFPTYGDNQIRYDGDVTFTFDAKPGESAGAGAGMCSITIPVDVLAPVFAFGDAKVTAGFATGIGQGLICTVQDQIILGRYNAMKVISGEYTSDPECAFAIGNGASDSSRSNALAVKWNGDLSITGKIMSGNYATLFKIARKTLSNVTISAGTITDKEIAIAETGWTPIAIRGFDIDGGTTQSPNNMQNARVLSARIDSSNKGWIQVRNDGSSNMQLTLHLDILYMRSSAFSRD